MGLSPILSVVYTIIIGTMLNFNTGNSGHGRKKVTCKQSFNTLFQVQHGVRGTVLDRKNNRIEAAEISLSSGGQTVYSGQNGMFWKILRPGKYTISVTAPGFNTMKKVSGVCTV